MQWKRGTGSHSRAVRRDSNRCRGHTFGGRYVMYRVEYRRVTWPYFVKLPYEVIPSLSLSGLADQTSHSLSISITSTILHSVKEGKCSTIWQRPIIPAPRCFKARWPPANCWCGLVGAHWTIPCRQIPQHRNPRSWQHKHRPAFWPFRPKMTTGLSSELPRSATLLSEPCFQADPI